uniref:Uncharacterized protein n=2 Tax=Cajanus cajan TaxID=3821 RepID=A0A151TMW0_CAJCA|nr:hypothetical protein KK1_022028 [Cajanus cajan]
MAKTVPLEGSKFDDIENLKLKLKGTVNKVHSPRWKWKWKSKSKSDFLINTQSNSTSSNSKQNRGNIVKCNKREQNMSTITKTASLPTCSKRQERQLLWSTHYETTWKHAKRKQTQNAERHNLLTVASVVVIILVSMMVWGRLWSIICTSICFYLIPCFTTTPQYDKQSDSNDLVLDFKRKPIQRCSTSL